MLTPSSLLAWNNRVSDISLAKTGLSGINGNCSSVFTTVGSYMQVLKGPRERDYYYRRERKLAGLRLRNESKAFHWLILARKEAESCSLLVSLCHCNCIYQNYQRFSRGTMGIIFLHELSRGWWLLLSGEMLFCLEQIPPSPLALNSLWRC